MRALLQTAVALIRDRRAATAVEYGFLLALIVLAIMAALVELGGVTTDMWNNVSNKVQATN
jgi:pilus assembly protein Flp/PilA